MNRFITFARIVKTYGKNGAVVVEPIRKINEKRLTNLEVFIAPPLLERSITKVIKALVKDKRLILFFEGVEDISQAEHLTGRYLQTSERFIDNLFLEGEEDCLGFKCITSSGDLIGSVADILISPAHRIFLIKRENDEILVPDVSEYIESIDEKNGIIVIREGPYIKNWKDNA
ncbi:MAG: ribosome maturation factor RimM [Actinobacteria bacterium]|nr:ribosome maturation factor RimM [Actinomycetota bacterium]